MLLSPNSATKETYQSRRSHLMGPEEDAAFKKLKDSITSDDTMAFFDPRKLIVVRTEASFHAGLSAGLFQRTAKGLQPVHYTAAFRN